MSKAHVDFLLNEEKISIKDLDTNTTVLNYLRNNHELTGTKEGCASGDCGACTAVVGELKENKISYKSINTCITFLYSLHGKQLITVEHIQKNKLHPVQQSMIDSDGSQCGFCTPGIIMSMYNMYENKIKPTEENIDKFLSGNLCRCTGYLPIKKAIKNMYSYKSNKFSKSKVIRLLKSIKKTDIVIKKNDSKFFIHYNLNSLIKDYQKISNGHLLVGGTDLALEVTKKRKDLKKQHIIVSFLFVFVVCKRTPPPLLLPHFVRWSVCSRTALGRTPNTPWLEFRVVDSSGSNAG